jgi:anti-anti-sigma factor
MLIDIEQTEATCILRFQGRFVAGVDPEFLRSKSEEIKKLNCTRVLADLSEVSAIGSTGMGFLVGIYTSVTRLPDGRFVLVAPQPRVREVLDLTRLSTVIPTAPDRASAMAILRGANAHGR